MEIEMLIYRCTKEVRISSSILSTITKIKIIIYKVIITIKINKWLCIQASNNYIITIFHKIFLKIAPNSNISSNNC